MMDYYLESSFPEKGVRYIAVAENVDTINGLSDFAPFKNLFNEMHAKGHQQKGKDCFQDTVCRRTLWRLCSPSGTKTQIKKPSDN